MAKNNLNNKSNPRRCIMKEKIKTTSRIEVSRNKRMFKETRYSVLLMVNNSFIVCPLLNTHSSPALLFTPEFQSKGGMISL